MFRNNYQEGEKIGELIFIRRAESKPGEPKAIFKCQCGNEFATRVDSAKNGRTKSCGCKSRELLSKAGTGRKQTNAAKAKLVSKFSGIGNEERTLDLKTLNEQDRSRFWNKVALTANPDKCWEWLGSKRKGYGRFSVRISKGVESTLVATRLSYFLHHGQDPKGLIMRHTCDNKGCVNPNHILAGSSKDNTLDMMNRGRGGGQFSEGEWHKRAKLTNEQVLDIREKYRLGCSQPDLAEIFGISQSGISNIIKNKNWKHI